MLNTERRRKASQNAECHWGAQVRRTWPQWQPSCERFTPVRESSRPTLRKTSTGTDPRAGFTGRRIALIRFSVAGRKPKKSPEWVAVPGLVLQVFIQGREDELPPDSIISPCSGAFCTLAHTRGMIFSVGFQ